MDLVEDHGVEAFEQVGSGQQHVAQHLGRHHHDWGSGFDGRVAGQEPDVLGPIGGTQLAVFLVGQGFEWSRVKGLGAAEQGPVDGVGGDEGLARSGRGRDEHAVPGVEGTKRLELEVVRRERKLGFEVPLLTRRRGGPGEHGQRPSSLPTPMARK